MEGNCDRNSHGNHAKKPTNLNARDKRKEDNRQERGIAEANWLRSLMGEALNEKYCLEKDKMFRDVYFTRSTGNGVNYNSNR